MDLNASSQEATHSTIRNATTKMELCLNDIEFSLNNLFKSRLDKLRSKVKKQTSLNDVRETMRHFEAYFNEVIHYSETENFSFKRQLGIILGDDDDGRQHLPIEGNLSGSFSLSDNKNSICDTPQQSKVLQRIITSSVSGSICGLDEEKKSIEAGDESKENQNLSNSKDYEDYDSSNDLPEAKASARNQVPNSSQSTSNMNTFPNDSDPTVFNDDEPGNSTAVPDTNGEVVSDVNLDEKAQSIGARTDENADPGIGSGLSTPVLDKTIKGDKNEKTETTKSQEEEMEGLNAQVNEAPLDATDLPTEKKTNSLPSKRRNEMDATSRKVNDWLNKSLQSDSMSVDDASNDEDYQDFELGVDDDAKTEICDVDSDSKTVKENGDVINDNDNSSTINILSKDSAKDEDVIEVSDEEIFGTGTSISSKLTKFMKHCEKKKDKSSTPIKMKGDDLIEVVELEELCDDDTDEVCLIESSQELKDTEKTETRNQSTHYISESSDETDRIKAPSKCNGNLNISSSSSQSLSNMLTQNINSEVVDEAKRNLLESSSSSPSSASGGTESQDGLDGWDSGETRIVRKRRKLKKKRKKQDLNKSQTSEAKSLNEESKIDRLLDFRNLGKRRRVSGSSDSSVESKSVASSNDKVIKKKKTKKLKLSEDESNHFSNNEKSEPEIDEADVRALSSNMETKKNDDADIYRRMLLESDSSGSSDNECPSSPDGAKSRKTEKKVAKTNVKEPEDFLEDSGKKKKKRKKFDPLLHGKFSLSDSESEDKTRRRKSPESQIYDQKYEKLLEKRKKKQEAQQNESSSSDEETNVRSINTRSQNREKSEPMNFVSYEPECVDVSEDDSSEDERSTIGYHQISSSSEEDDDIQYVPQSQESNSPTKSGRRNIRKVISAEEMTTESKRAAKEEEERRKRVSEKEKLLSQTFSAPEVDKLILDFDKDTKQELITVHPGLMAVLKKHQIDGIKFMWNTCFETVNQVNTTAGSGCVLAHCMGLGKSLQIVTLVHTIINHPILKLRTVLIICPKSVVLNWGDEFNKWLKDIQRLDKSNKKVEVFDLSGLVEIPMKERGLRDWQKKGGVLLMSYNSFRALVSPTNMPEKYQQVYDEIRKHLVDPGPDVAVFDEGHLLKNNLSYVNKAANQLRTKRRIVLTGTPMQNNLMEYYYMVNLVKPNYLGDKKEFSNRFFNPINNGQFQDSTPQDVKIMKSRAHVLCKKLDGIVQRFDSNIFEKHLPERYEYVLKLRMSELQIKLYKQFLDSIQKSSTGTQEIEKTRILMKSEKVLSLICSHPKILSAYVEPPKPSTGTSEPDASEKALNAEAELKKCLEDEGVNVDDVTLSPKTALFFEILKKCAENEDKLLVFSQHLKTLDLIEFFLKKVHNSSANFFQPNSSKETWIAGRDYFRLDGSTVQADRKKYCQIFNSENKRARLFLLSTKAGGLGLNLTGANRAIVFDVSWNPSADSQSVFRIYRFGQSKPCYIYRFVMKGTMEEKKYHRQVSKLSTSSRVVDKRQVGRHFQEKYLRSLFEYNFDYVQNPSCPKRPQDIVLSELLLNSSCIDAYEEHDILLMNVQDEELTEEDRKKAWDDYENEKNGGDVPPPMGNPSAQRPSTSGGFTARGMSPLQQQQYTEYLKAYQEYARKQEGVLPSMPIFLQKKIEQAQDYQFRVKCAREKKIPLPYQPLSTPTPLGSAQKGTGEGTSSNVASNSEKFDRPREAPNIVIRKNGPPSKVTVENTEISYEGPPRSADLIENLLEKFSKKASSSSTASKTGENLNDKINPNGNSQKPQEKTNAFSNKTPSYDDGRFRPSGVNIGQTNSKEKTVQNSSKEVPGYKPPPPPYKPRPPPLQTASLSSNKNINISKPTVKTNNCIDEKRNRSENSAERVATTTSNVNNNVKSGSSIVNTSKQMNPSENSSQRVGTATSNVNNNVKSGSSTVNTNNQMNPRENPEKGEKLSQVVGHLNAGVNLKEKGYPIPTVTAEVTYKMSEKSCLKENSIQNPRKKPITLTLSKPLGLKNQQNGEEDASGKKMRDSDTENVLEIRKLSSKERSNLPTEPIPPTKSTNSAQGSDIDGVANDIPRSGSAASSTDESKSTHDEPSALNSIIEEIKSYVWAKKNGESI